jgi:hypothetical protein
MKIIRYIDVGFGLKPFFDFIESYRTDIKFIEDKTVQQFIFDSEGLYRYQRDHDPDIVKITYLDENHRVGNTKNVINSVYHAGYEKFYRFNLEFIRPIISFIRVRGKDNLLNLRKKDLIKQAADITKFGCCFINNNLAKTRANAIKYINDNYKPVINLHGVAGYLQGDFYTRLNEKIDLSKQYKFLFAMENSLGDNYNTEKLPEAALTSGIPVYWGDDNKFINNVINKESYIHLDKNADFSSWINQIKTVDNDNDVYKHMINQKIFINVDPVYEQIDGLVDFITDFL